MAYNIEIRLASKNGWHTPAEARAYYGRYARDGVTWHWWNSPDKVKDSDHDNIVNYLLSKAERGVGSVNYVLSNNKITLVVNPDNVAWASQSGNPTTISVELSPHLNAEGYKKAGWLFNELEGRYGKVLKHFKHSYWNQTECPGTIDINRIKSEANKWKSGSYNPQPPTPPAPTPVPPTTPNITFHLWKEGEIRYVANKQPTQLYNVDTKTWAGIKPVISNTLPLNKGALVVIVGHIHNKALNRDYYITRSSFDGKRPTGFHPADLDVYVPPRPTPEPPTDPVEPTDPVPPKPEPEPEPTPDPSYPKWFVEFWERLIEAIRVIIKGKEK